MQSLLWIIIHVFTDKADLLSIYELITVSHNKFIDQKF